ncbi:uronyl 2-sulfotransferase [Tribolium castaneum]|uniref:Heparan sulfate 2-O-sulfotransferase pipe-like Protein n=1 Tax=Tribolium castaneum TaxID=7070 RepID=D6X0E7_TRICA|nr:PREDICTED: uronyl 2-sulfotransferase [Tribolium castaneum]EFA10533.1 Heparan sulfate 2-O-sulfotransferase pipe-like Protein [Tribolium castaneum]|eukprot:XP_001809848.1 PREDICTED: uronyl 2-sulfotransferase [Tribolium castaneum]
MFRKVRRQWLCLPILVTFMFSSLLLMRDEPVRVLVVSTETPKHVTKSMAQLGRMDEINKFVLLLNPVPNCGGEILVFLLQKMQGLNNYRHVRLKGGGVRRLNGRQQEEFVDKLYRVMREEAVPLSFDRQLLFVNFTTYDKQSPTYINIVREPADKAISRSFYNNKNTDSDLIACLAKGKGNCEGRKVNPYQLTIPYFCGHDPKCMLDNQWALQTAKNNVEKYYPVVGVLEELNATLEVLENEIPYFFKGVQGVYRKKMISRFNRRKTSQPVTKTRKQLHRILATEYDFYYWVKRRLFNQRQLFK